MKRITAVVFGLSSGLVFLATLVMTIGFVGNFGMSHSVDSVPRIPTRQAIIIDLALVSVIVLQHVAVNHLVVRQFLASRLPVPLLPAVRVLAGCLVVLLLLRLWEPVGVVIWHLEGQRWVLAGRIGSALGWITFLAGSAGCARDWVIRPSSSLESQLRREAVLQGPRIFMASGLVIALWSTSSMTLGHLLLALVAAVWVLPWSRLRSARQHAGPVWPARF